MSMIINPYAFESIAPIAATWNPAFKSTPAVLSSGNLRLAANPASSGDYANSRSTRAIQGLCYLSFSAQSDAGGLTYAIGVADSTYGANTTPASPGDSSLSVGLWGQTAEVWFNGANLGAPGPLFDAGTEGQIAIRAATRRVWVRLAGGAWFGGGDPAADTSPTATLAGTGAIYAVGCVYRPGASSRYVQLAGDAASTTGAVPSCFTAANWAP